MQRGRKSNDKKGRKEETRCARPSTAAPGWEGSDDGRKRLLSDLVIMQTRRTIVRKRHEDKGREYTKKNTQKKRGMDERGTKIMELYHEIPWLLRVILQGTDWEENREKRSQGKQRREE